MKNHAVTLVLLLVAVGLGVWLWRDRDRVTAGEKQRRENNVFPAWRRDELTRIEVTREDETIVLERAPAPGQPAGEATWRMTSPRQERADVAALERLETTLEFATVVRKVGRGDERALGLEAPRARGAITMGGLVVRFALGAPSPRPEGSAYFVVDDGEPFVVSKELAASLLAGADAYRDRTVVPYLSLELQSFTVEKPSGPDARALVLDRLDDRSFTVRGPGLLASRSAIDQLWGTLAEIRAEAFPKDADADALTAHPRLRVRMTPKEAAKGEAELVFGDACPGHPEDVVVLRRVPSRVAACAPKGAAEALAAVTADSLVDRRPFSFRADEIEELRLEWLAPPDAGAEAPRAIELARRGHGFHQREPVDRELPPDEADAAGELLGRIEIAAADEVVHGGGPFAAVARARVRSGEHEETVELAAAEPGTKRALRRVRDDARLLVSAAVARRLEPRRTSLRPRTLLDETRRVHRVLLQCGVEQELVDEGSGLRMVRPAGYETDGSITQLVDGLLKGKVLAWVADADDGTFGLESSRPRCDVVLSFEDGNSPARVRFGAEGEGGVYGVVEGRPDVFSVAPALRTLAERIYVSRASLRVHPAAIESVKVRSRSTPAAPLADAAALRDAAGVLLAERVVALGPTEPAPAPVDLEVTIALAEGGPPKRIACAAAEGSTGARRCWTPSVRAVFEVSRTTLGRFFASVRPIPADAGVDAR